MDTSETYIKMCEEAKEVKKECEMGDWIASATQCLRNKKSKRNVRVVEYLEEKRGMIIVHSRESCKTMDASYLPDVVWLPRQDQLQEIIAPPYSSQHSIYGLPHTFARFVEFSDGQASDYIQQFHSMEQLWLAFVMKERWNKTWNGNDWVCPG